MSTWDSSYHAKKRMTGFGVLQPTSSSKAGFPWSSPSPTATCRFAFEKQSRIFLKHKTCQESKLVSCKFQVGFDYPKVYIYIFPNFDYQNLGWFYKIAHVQFFFGESSAPEVSWTMSSLQTSIARSPAFILCWSTDQPLMNCSMSMKRSKTSRLIVNPATSTNDYKTHHVKNHWVIQNKKKMCILSSALSKTRKSCQGPGEVFPTALFGGSCGFFRPPWRVCTEDFPGGCLSQALPGKIFSAWGRHNLSATSMEHRIDEDESL